MTKTRKLSTLIFGAPSLYIIFIWIDLSAVYILYTFRDHFQPYFNPHWRRSVLSLPETIHEEDLERDFFIENYSKNWRRKKNFGGFSKTVNLKE